MLFIYRHCYHFHPLI